MPKVHALTSLRFIAAAMVFLHHYICAGGWTHFGAAHLGDIGQSWWAVLLFEMRVGVTLFFVLSGFLLTIRYYDSLLRGTSIKAYWVKRFARIMPLYWTLLLVMLAYYLYQGKSTEHFLVFATLTQGFFSDLKFDGLGTAWSLTVEECFYLTLPVVILAIRWFWPEKSFRWWKMALAVGVVYLTSVILWDIGNYLHDRRLMQYGGFLKLKGDLRIYTIFGRFLDFGFGSLFGILYMKANKIGLNYKYLADAVILLSTAAMIYVCTQIFFEAGKRPSIYNFETRTGWHMNFYNALFSGLIIYFLCSSSSYITRLLSWRPFVYLGEISFAFYLIHFNHIAFHLYWWTADLGIGFWGEVILLYAIISILSALAYEMVERPAQHLILEKVGLIRDTVRRPTFLRLLGMAPYASVERSARRLLRRRRPAAQHS